MADSKLRVNLIGDASSLTRSLQIATARMDAFGRKATQIGKNLSLRLTLPIGLAAGAAIKMASDMEESTNKVRVAFGSSSKQVEAFAETALRSFGIAESSALDMTALFGDMATGMGISRDEAANLSTNLVGLAGDLASFKNINIEEVTTALSGVFTGETESLKRLGIVMTEVNLEQFALQQGIGKTVKQMSQQEKIMLRLQYIFSVTGNAQGDFARTSEGAANQMRIFQESLKEVGAELGSIMLPVFTKAITKVNYLLKEFRELDKGTQQSIVQFGLIVAAVPPLIFALGQLAQGFAAVNKAVIFLSSTKGLGAIGAAVTLAIAALDRLSESIAPALNMLERFGTILEFIGTPHLIAPMLKLRDGIKEVEKAQKDLNKEAEKTVDIPAQTAQAPVFTKTVDPENLALKEMAQDANATALALDEMLRTDSTFQFALAKDTAAVELFGNIVKQTAESVRTPMEEVDSKIKELSETTKTFLNQLGLSLQNAFMSLLNAKNPIEALKEMLLSLIKRLAAAAFAAAILSAIIGSFTGGASFLHSLGGFKGLFSQMAGFGGLGTMPGSGQGNISSMGNIGLSGAMQNNNINLTGQFRLDGQDLVLAVERANNIRGSFI